MAEVGALIAAVFLASVLGSLHCAGMCGPFLLFAVAAHGESKPRSAVMIHAAYHGGRLLSYAALGIIAGFLGQALDFGGSFVGVQRTAAVIAGSLMVTFGLVAALQAMGKSAPSLHGPAWVRTRLANVVKHGHRLAFDLEPAQRALVVGLLTTLLPCGWLYAFAITAAGTGSPGWGGITMAVFWAGTLPVMVSLGAGLAAVSGPVRRFIPVVSCVVVVGVGVATIIGRVQLPVMTRESLGIVLPAGMSEAAGAIREVQPHALPCCEADEP